MEKNLVLANYSIVWTMVLIGRNDKNITEIIVRDQILGDIDGSNVIE